MGGYDKNGNYRKSVNVDEDGIIQLTVNLKSHEISGYTTRGGYEGYVKGYELFPVSELPDGFFNNFIYGRYQWYEGTGIGGADEVIKNPNFIEPPGIPGEDNSDLIDSNPEPQQEEPVTREEYDSLKEQLEKQQKLIEELMKQLGMKGA